MTVFNATSAAARLLGDKDAEIRILTDGNETVSIRLSEAALVALGKRIEDLFDPRDWR